MSLIADIIAYSLFWLFGWYLILIGGIALIIVGIYFGLYFMIIPGVILVIDGIIGLVFRKRFGKKLGDGLAGSIFIISFGLIILILNQYFFGNEVFLILSLVMFLLGPISMFFSIRKYKKEKLKQEKHEKLIEEREKAFTERLAKSIEEQEKIVQRSIEYIICDYLESNKGKAFTVNSISKRCEELEEFEIQEIAKVLSNLRIIGKINSQKKEEEIYYYAF